MARWQMVDRRSSIIGQLRRHDHRDGIARVLLIGSVLEGNVSAESDVDLVVFGVGELQSVRTLCAEAAFETGLDNGDYREATDLAYNAAETAVKALLRLEMGDLPKTHGGIVNRFGDLYVRTGKLPRTLGRDLNLALEIRGRTRYEEERAITREDAKEVLALADQLLQQVMQFRETLPEIDKEKDDDN